MRWLTLRNRTANSGGLEPPLHPRDPIRDAGALKSFDRNSSKRSPPASWEVRAVLSACLLPIHDRQTSPRRLPDGALRGHSCRRRHVGAGVGRPPTRVRATVLARLMALHPGRGLDDLPALV